MSTNESSSAYTEVAIIGMNGRFPGSNTLEEYWKNLCEGVESVCTFINPAIHARRSIRGGRMEGVELFDASFFGFNPREAEVTDPQHRIMLECAWAALESAGYDPQSYLGSIGVFVGASPAWYGIRLFSNPQVVETLGQMQVLVGTDGHFLATRLSYKLNLRGISMSVKTACSTSLVATHVACQSLLNGECDMALAGGVGLPLISFSIADWQSINSTDGGILSSDGHCRAFDADAQGTIAGDGAGIVVLKRLEDALRDGDSIEAVIKGSAVNNDGSMKIGYTAPSMEAQAKVISEAMAVAGIDPESITYVETHGTGTLIGDPIEVAALTQAFRANGCNGKRRFCAIGSVKTNVGHLDGAAGVAGLIKAALAVKHGRIPPSLHFKKPNPNIDFENSPFYVNHELKEWKTNGLPRRAGVSAFGIGGTNAHIVLEEAPAREPSPSLRARNLLVLSARTRAGLERATANLQAHLEANPNLNLDDAAYTLQVGRRHFGYRRAFAAENREEAIRTLNNYVAQAPVAPEVRSRAVQFLFPGQGPQYVNMGLELYQTEPVFREAVDRCCRFLEPELGFDLRTLIYPSVEEVGDAEQRLNQTANTQPAVFMMEYALAQLWMEWGVRPAAMVGHSFGEYAAATIAEVFSLEDALMVVAARGRLIQGLPTGAMMAVPLGEAAVMEYLGGDISLAAVSGPAACVVSGGHEAVQQLQQRLLEQGIDSHLLAISHAVHSHRMEPIMDAFAAAVKAAKLSVPKIPYASNLSGKWITAEEATDVQYWVRQLREPVRIADGMATLATDPHAVMLEVGPGRTLNSLIRHNVSNAADRTTACSLRHSSEQRSDQDFILNALGKMWAAGVSVDWQSFHRHEKRYRVPLPTYPFERRRYWVDFEPTSTADTGGEQQAEDQGAAIPLSLRSEHGRPDLGVAYVEPRTPMEKRISELWGAVLGIEQIGVQDNFFDLGGHSLVAIQLIGRLRSSFGVEITPEVFFNHPTIESFAVEMEARGVKAAGNEQPTPVSAARGAAPPLQQGVRPALLPLSYAQQRLWFIDQLQGSSTEYNLPSTYHLRGALDVAAFQRALDAIVERHEILRTRFVMVDNQPAQVIDPPRPVNLNFENLSGLDTAGQTERLQALRGQEWKQPFDLENGTLMRMRLLKLAADHHVLLRTLHHIISDVWSESVLNEEISILYTAFHEGRVNPLKPLEVQYADFTLWQRKWLNEEAQSGELAYWREQLTGIPEQLELAKDRPRGMVQTFAGAVYHTKMSSESAARVKRFAQSSQATLYMTLLSAFALLLQRYSGQDDIVVGSPMANRQDPQLERLIGFFINTLVMRVQVKGGQTFSELLKAVRGTTLAAYAHQNLPFERLVEILASQRSLNTTPIFQVLFAVQNAPMSARQPQGLQMVPFLGAELPADGMQVGFDVELHVWELDGTIQFYWLYNRDLFDSWRIEQMARHYVKLLESIVAVPDQPIGQLEMLETEDRRLLESWNGTERTYTGGELVHELFERQAAERPGATAAIFDNTSLSYAELNRQANRLAHYLKRLGVGPEETRVALCVERGLEMLVGLLGILKAGGAYVPLDPEYPPERLSFILKDSAPLVLLTQRHLHGLLAGVTEAVTVDLDQPNAWSSEAETNPARGETGLDGRYLAYVIYTSGSTGTPKGVMVEHASVVNFLRSMQEEPGIGADDLLLAITTLTFDIAGLELYLPLTVGASLRILPREATMEGARLIKELENGATVMQATPATWRLLLEAGWQGRQHLKVLCGGEVMSPDLARQLVRRSKSVWNLYGPTETTIWSLAHKLEDIEDKVPVGRPIANTQIHILDGQGRPAPIGVAGELCIAGAGVARGYLNRPELTAERFVRDPFSAEPGARMYKTGDLARWLPDGTIEFLGRNDFQVKVRGYRIEPGEIEARLTRHAGVQEAVVIAREDTAGEKRLVAYYTVAEDFDREKVGTDTLRSRLASELPEYMVPAVYIQLDQMPLTTNGKLDRKKLPAPDREAHAAAGYEEPTGEVEKIMAEIWAEVLGINRIGRHDNFFELGGHSLLAMRLRAGIRNRLDYDLSLMELFQNPTIAKMAQQTKRSTRQTPSRILVPLQPLGSYPPFFCVHPVGGQVFCYGELSLELGPDVPFYGLQSPPDSSSTRSETVEQMASLYIQEIRRIQEHGPYILGGWSLGGLIAFEMARQLKATGEAVALLALFDTYPPSRTGGVTSAEPWAMLERFGLEMQWLTGKDVVGWRSQFARLSPEEGRRMVIEDLVRSEIISGDNAEREFSHLFSVYTRNVRAMERYSPPLQDQSILLFKAAESENPQAVAEEWRAYVGGVELQMLSGNHYTILRRPAVSNLAVTLKNQMDAALELNSA